MEEKNWDLEKIENWLVTKLSSSLELNENEIDITKPFSEYGLDSVTTVEISGDLESLLDIRLNPTALFEFYTIEKLSNHLFKETNKNK